MVYPNFQIWGKADGAHKDVWELGGIGRGNSSPLLGLVKRWKESPVEGNEGGKGGVVLRIWVPRPESLSSSSAERLISYKKDWETVGKGLGSEFP